MESDDAKKTTALRSLGVPPQLAQVLLEEDRQIGLRIFVLDNSRSTMAHDGHIFRKSSLYPQSNPNPIIREDCSRWEEIKHMAMEQAEWAAMMGTPCEFRLLNTAPPPLREGVDFARLNNKESTVSVQEQLATLSTMLNRVVPQGGTPIAQRLDDVYTRIKQDHRELAGLGQRVVVVLATDGCPTSNGKSAHAAKQEVVQCIKKLTTELPVFMVVRLTCDDNDVIRFYNELDAEIELNLEVLDDIENEASEVYSNGNGWLTYTPIIHKIREGGTFLKLLDVLDERPLTAVEIVLLAKLLLTPEDQDPEVFREKLAVQGDSQDSEKLLDVLAEYSKDSALVYSPYHRRMMKPVDMALVRGKVLSPMMLAKQAWSGVCNAIKTLYPTRTLAEMARDALLDDPKKSKSVRAVKFMELGLAQSMQTINATESGY
jgi:hypothetical protein